MKSPVSTTQKQCEPGEGASLCISCIALPSLHARLHSTPHDQTSARCGRWAAGASQKAACLLTTVGAAVKQAKPGKRDCMHIEPAASGQAAEKMKRPIVPCQAGRQQRNHQPSLHAMTLPPTVTCGPPSLQPTTRRAISEAVLFPVSRPAGWLLHSDSSSRLTCEVKARTSPPAQTFSSARLEFLPVVIRNFRYFATSGKTAHTCTGQFFCNHC